MSYRVLIVEDEFLQVQALEVFIASQGHSVCAVAKTAEEALYFAKSQRPDVVLMDVRLNGHLDGIDAAVLISKTCNCGIVFLTGYVNGEARARIRSVIPDAVTLFKPSNGPRIASAMMRAVNNKTLTAGTAELAAQADTGGDLTR